MEGERSKYFKEIMNSVASDVKWKKRDALNTLRTENSATNTKPLFSDVKSSNDVTNQLVTTVEVHQVPMRDKENDNEEVPEPADLVAVKEQICEVQPLTRENSKELQPSLTEIIPEKEMEIIRQSLEGENTATFTA